jgi:hypothetical protein
MKSSEHNPKASNGVRKVEPFIPIIKDWSFLGSEVKPYIERCDIKVIRDLTESFLRFGGHRDELREKRRELLAFVFQKEFETKQPEEILELFRDAYRKEKEWTAQLKKEALQEYREGEGEESTPRVEKQKTKEQRRLGKYMSNVLSPTSYNYLKLKHKKGEGLIEFKGREEKEGEEREFTFEVKRLTDRSEVIIDFLFDRKAKSNGAELLKKEPEEAGIIPFEEFINALDMPEGQTDTPRSVSFTSTELRKQLGIRITDKEVQKAVRELYNTEIQLEGVKIWCEKSGDGKSYRKVTLNDRIVYSFGTEETGRKEPRTEAKQHRFKLLLGSGWEMIFHNDIINRRYSCFPKEFYKVSRKARALGRYLSCFKEGKLNIEQASEIAGYDNTTNLTKKKNGIEKKLEELKKIGILKSWEREKKRGKEKTGKRITWRFKRP